MCHSKVNNNVFKFVLPGDGLPSMTSIDGTDDISESSDLQKARKLYAELQMMSTDSVETEVNYPGGLAFWPDR